MGSQANRVFSEVVYLASFFDYYNNWRMVALKRFFLQPIEKGQYFLIRENDKPVAFFSYAFVGDEAVKQLVAGERSIGFDEWKTGDNLFIPDIVSPFGLKASWVKYVRDELGKRYGDKIKAQWLRSLKGRSGYALTRSN
jgi:hemolysin-activating ACP:hemolysin acyltransferase